MLRCLFLSLFFITTASAQTVSGTDGRSAQLKYAFDDSIKAFAFYTEFTINKDAAQTLYVPCGFSHGYLGLRINNPADKRIVFAVHNSPRENATEDTGNIQLLATGENITRSVATKKHGEGYVEMQWSYAWKTDVNYKMLLTSLPDSATQTTIYSGYIFLPELQKWKLIASVRILQDGKALTGLYASSQLLKGANAKQQRQISFGNQWIQRDNGQWKELLKSEFSVAAAKQNANIVFNAGVDSGKFFLVNGAKPAGIKAGELLDRTATNEKPVIDWTKNADSVAQAAKDKQMILSAVASHQIDTTSSKDGVYYQIVKEGTGDHVLVTDTVTVFYKGTLLKDGTIFDQTKEKPATFPLKRLIRGWQIAVPECRVGGKIRIFIPSATGYMMRARSKDIVPNSVLVFDIEVVSLTR